MSGKGNHGTVNGPIWTVQGKYDNALVFDGTNDWVTINHASNLSLTTTMTLSTWIYRTASQSGWHGILQKEGSGSLVYFLHLFNNQLSFGLSIGGNEQIVTAGGTLALNQWIHLAATYDGSWQRLYINGIEVGSRAQTGVVATNTTPFRIGGNSLFGEYFAGRIDDVRLYNRVLSMTEIQGIMNVPLS
jgi:hypothetical protein